MDQPSSFHILAKPTGPLCNLDCKYCFYTEKENLFPKGNTFQMSDTVLEAYIQQYITSQETNDIVFAWQGGEPTLRGLDFFRKAVLLQDRYANGKRITNTIQTNGTLLNDEWCDFFNDHSFLVGLSLDGPEHIHDAYRIDRGGRPTFGWVMRALSLLKKHRVEFNVLTCVTKYSSYKPLEIYDFLKNQEIQFIQFIPIVEREPNKGAEMLSLRHATPPSLSMKESEQAVTSWTVEPEMYGDFLIQIFNEWVKNDVGSTYVMNFEWALASWAGIPSPVCIFSEECGRAVAMEHNGDLYSCDHFVYPQYLLGNITKKSLGEMMNARSQIEFGRNKREKLPLVCRNCDVRFACHGECPKHRFIVSDNDEPGLNYLCSSYKKYFKHIDPYMKIMNRLLLEGLPVSFVKRIIEEESKLSKFPK
jgi:uncharacterized protein